MSRSSTEILTELLAPVVASLDCELWGLEYHSAGRKRGVLRIYIEKPDGVTLSDCEKVSRQASSVLDVEDPIHGEYVLEVSSPGMDRPLYTAMQYKQYIGQRARIKLQQPFEGRRQFSGKIVGVENDEVQLIIDNEEYSLPLEGIEKANIAPQFGGDGKSQG